MIQNKHDWEIHKILSQAKGNVVYICPARGNGKLYNQLDIYADLMTQKNRDISIIRATDVETAIKLLPKQPSWYEVFAVHLHEKFNDYYFRRENSEWASTI